MTPHADPTNTVSVAAKIAQLPLLPMESLWAIWDEHFDERPGHHQRAWLESRLAYRIQERAYGGVKTSVRRRLEEIGKTGILPGKLRGEAGRLLPGTVLTRVYDDIEHRVLVRGSRDLEYDGKRFSSLSAVANAITGSHWSGPVFFGLKTRKTEAKQ